MSLIAASLAEGSSRRKAELAAPYFHPGHAALIEAGHRRLARRADGKEELEVRVAEAPADGVANAAVIKLLSEALHVPRSQVEIVSGLTSRHKRVKLPLEAGEVRRRLPPP